MWEPLFQLVCTFTANCSRNSQPLLKLFTTIHAKLAKNIIKVAKRSIWILGAIRTMAVITRPPAWGKSSEQTGKNRIGTPPQWVYNKSWASNLSSGISQLWGVWPRLERRWKRDPALSGDGHPRGAAGLVLADPWPLSVERRQQQTAGTDCHPVCRPAESKKGDPHFSRGLCRFMLTAEENCSRN